MNLNGEKRTAPAVEAIVEMFPEDFLGNTVRENGLIIRERKIDPVILFRVLTPGFGVRFLSTIRGLKRKYEEKAGVKLSISSFYELFTPEMVDFLQWCVLHAIVFQAQQPGRVLGDSDKYLGWTLAQGLHPAPRARILQVPLLRQNRSLWRLFR